jgi:hypothetical protein
MSQQQLIDAFLSGDLGQVEFFELAQDAGMDLAEIGVVLAEAEEEL